MESVYAYRVSLPGTINGLTVMNDGGYIVLINENKCYDVQQSALEHELKHIG